jgi:hypothetical protein
MKLPSHRGIISKYKNPSIIFLLYFSDYVSSPVQQFGARIAKITIGSGIYFSKVTFSSFLTKIKDIQIRDIVLYNNN